MHYLFKMWEDLSKLTTKDVFKVGLDLIKDLSNPSTLATSVGAIKKGTYLNTLREYTNGRHVV